MVKKLHQLTIESCRAYIQKELFEPKDYPVAPATSPGLIGVELETFPLRFGNAEKTLAKPVSLEETISCLKEVLQGLSIDWGKSPLAQEPLSPIRFPYGASFQYEPGGQIELVTPPCSSLPALIAQLDFQQKILADTTEKHGIHFAQVGTNPWFGAEQIGLQLDKPRYRALQEYFSEIGPYGIQMMRQTCSLHVNLDFGKEEQTQIKRLVATNLLVPFATAIFANSSILERKPTGKKSYRSFIWQQLDPKRSGIWIGKKCSLPSKEALVNAYLDFALQAPVLHIERLGDRIFPKETTFESWLENPIEGLYPSLPDLENHLSLLYPEIRPKGFLEIRTSDALSKDWQLAPAFFYTGLLYSDQALARTLDLLFPKGEAIESLWRKASFGFASPELLELSQSLMQLAIDGLGALPPAFVGEAAIAKLEAYFAHFTARGRSPADLEPLI